jgi:formate-dependent nitrite reductase membrane component NrfD
MGLEPACVVVCPTEAIVVGDVNDPTSRVAQLVQRTPVAVRRPEKETRPKVFYRGASQATLDPLAARRPDGGLFMWSEQGGGGDPQHVSSGHPGGWANSSAAAVLAYDVPHKAPWDWRVSLYTWTKGIAGGVYLIAVLLALTGRLPWDSDLLRWAAPATGLGFLSLTGALLIWDLEHPERFYFIFTRPQWRSWLVRGGFILGGYGAVLAAHLAASLFGAMGLQQVLTVAGIPLALMAAVYTAYLFAQSKARDLWQSPLLPPHMAIQAGLAGAGGLLLVAPVLDPGAGDVLAWVLAGACLCHLLFVWGEATLAHPTAHAHLAAWEMTRGRYARFFRAGLALVALGLAAPALGAWVVLPALAGLLAHEHAYVQAAQAVPLA